MSKSRSKIFRLVLRCFTQRHVGCLRNHFADSGIAVRIEALPLPVLSWLQPFGSCSSSSNFMGDLGSICADR
jgi:hypothetical protein